MLIINSQGGDAGAQMSPLLVKRSRERVLASRLGLRLFAVVHHQRHTLPMRIDEHLSDLTVLGC